MLFIHCYNYMHFMFCGVNNVNVCNYDYYHYLFISR